MKSKIFEAVEENNVSKKRKRIKAAADEEADSPMYKWLKNITHSNNELITSFVHNSKIEEELESDKEDGDDMIGANDKCLEKPTSIAIIRSAVETIMDVSFFAVSEEMQGCTIEI